jgi:transposase
MMGREDPPQPSLFYTSFNLDKRIRPNHPLRQVAKAIDFGFVSDEVEHLYGINGNVSVPPPVILKLLVLLMLYNVRSEREMMDTLPERLDWLWFLGYDLDSEIPHHSVLSKARRRWGADLFETFFERIVYQCVEAGLVEGKKIFVDASLVDANASKESIVDTHSLRKYFNRAYRELEKRLEDKGDDEADPPEDGKPPRQNEANSRHISTTDPEASVMRKGKGKAVLSYQAHRAVDGAYSVVTQTLIGPGDENEAHRLMELIDGHHANTGRGADTVVADMKYGTMENFLGCDRKGVRAHMPPLTDSHSGKGRRKGIFPPSAFVYDSVEDTMICPAGQTLTLRHRWEHRQACEYAARKEVCLACDLRVQCTRSQSTGRTVRRNFEQDKLDDLYTVARSQPSRRDIHIRQHFMERSFAEAGRYGFKRARWRGTERVRIQDYLIAAVQNIRLLVTHGKPKPVAAGTVGRLGCVNKVILSFLNIFRSQRFYLPGNAQASPPGVASCSPMTV